MTIRWPASISGAPLVFALLGHAHAPAQTSLTEEVLEIIDHVSFDYVFIDIDERKEASEKKHAGRLFEEIRKQKLPIPFQYPLIAVFEDPVRYNTWQVHRYRLGVRVEAGIEVSLPLKKERFSIDQVARVVQHGPYEFSRVAYADLVPRLEEQGYEIAAPSAERWLDDPWKVAPEHCRLEVLLPVKKSAEREHGGRNGQ